jgi:hypothetical protein
MTFPLWLIPIGFGFIALLIIAVWQRPPLTGRGRLFYALTGLSGIISGGLWLLWNATACGFGRPSSPSGPDTPLRDVLREMFAADGYLLSSLAACAVCAIATKYSLKATFGHQHRDDLPLSPREDTP